MGGQKKRAVAQPAQEFVAKAAGGVGNETAGEHETPVVCADLGARRPGRGALFPEARQSRVRHMTLARSAERPFGPGPQGLRAEEELAHRAREGEGKPASCFLVVKNK